MSSSTAVLGMVSSIGGLTRDGKRGYNARQPHGAADYADYYTYRKEFVMRCPRCGWRINTLTTEKAEEIKKARPNAWKVWSAEDDQLLMEMAKAGKNVGECAAALKRQPTAVQKRLDLLTYGAEQVYGPRDPTKTIEPKPEAKPEPSYLK